MKGRGAVVLCFQLSAKLPRSKSRVRIPCPALNLQQVRKSFQSSTALLPHLESIDECTGIGRRIQPEFQVFLHAARQCCLSFGLARLQLINRASANPFENLNVLAMYASSSESKDF